MNKILGLAVIGGGVYFLGDILGWWGSSAAASTTATSGAPPTTGSTNVPVNAANPPNVPVTAPPATWSLASPVSADINNAFKADFLINGTKRNLDVLPDGRVFDNSGTDVTASITALGIDTSAMFVAAQAAYAKQGSAAAPAVQTIARTIPYGRYGVALPVARIGTNPNSAMAGYSPGFASRRNYVRKPRHA